MNIAIYRLESQTLHPDKLLRYNLRINHPYSPKRNPMAWRIHLSNQAILSIHILAGKPSALAVWTRRDKVLIFKLDTGTLLSEISIKAPQSPRESEAWQSYLGKLRGAD